MNLFVVTINSNYIMECFTEYYKELDTDSNIDSNKKSKLEKQEKNQDVKKIAYQVDIGKSTSTKTQNICRAICFVAGVMLEAYTYKLDPKHSIGLGWGFLAAAVLF